MGLRRRALLALAGLAPDYWASRLQNPLFIVGVARSGTTLLNDLLAQHNDIAVLSEANDLWDPSGYPWNTSRHSSPPVWLDSDAYTERWWADAKPRATLIRAVFGVYQTLLHKPYFLNKTPLNTNRIGHLLDIFPDARFIHLVRDGRAVVRSYTGKVYPKVQMKPEPYQQYNVEVDEDFIAERLAEFWKRSLVDVQAADEQFNLTGQNRLIELTYEALCDDMRGTLTQLCEFIGIDPGQFHPDVWDTQAINQNHKWREAFTPDMAARLVESMQPQLKNKGYGDV